MSTLPSSLWIGTSLVVSALAAGSGSALDPTLQAMVPVGAIVGRVDVRLDFSPRRRPSIRELGVSRGRGRPNRGQTIVYLETAPQSAFEDGGARRAILDQRGETFVPYALPIRVGTSVEFPNSDDIYHNVFSLSKVRRFESRPLREGSVQVGAVRPAGNRSCVLRHSLAQGATFS